jgi:hypothetical protein
MSIEYISNDKFILKKSEPHGYSQRIEYDHNILQMINKRYVTFEEEGFNPEAEYTFKILKFKSTQIKLIENYDTSNKIIEVIDINKNKYNCLIL